MATGNVTRKIRAAVTGALSYTGRYVSEILFQRGCDVVNLSRRSVPIARHPLTNEQIESLATTRFDTFDPRGLQDVDVLFCTYWVRFIQSNSKGGETAHERAVRKCGELFDAAKSAGVKKIVFTSHTHATVDSPLEYLEGKAKACALLRQSGVNYSIVRPCGIFGDTADESILMNNAAWVLRRTPVFLLPGDGRGRFQPIHVRDMAKLMVDLGIDGIDSSGEEKDACGPDAPTAVELFTRIRKAVGGWGAIMPAGSWISPATITTLTKPIDWLTGDVLLDTGDLELLDSGLTVADDPSDPLIRDRRSLYKWIDDNKDDLGVNYVSSVSRYYQNVGKSS